MGKREGSKFPLLILWVLYFLVLFMLIYLTKTSIDKIFIGTLPILFYVIMFIAFHFYAHIKDFPVWIAPLIFPLIFFGIWYSELVPFLTNMDGLQLTIFNLIVCYLINIIFLIGYVEPKEHKKKHHTHHKARHPVKHPAPHPQHHQRIHHSQRTVHKQAQPAGQQQQSPHHYASQLHHYHRQNQQYVQEINRLKQQVQHLQNQPRITPETFQLNLKSIEDKCKAINFGIGRVYSDKKGGSKEARDKINIPREMYNAFSEMAKEFKQEHMGQLMQVLNEIYGRLAQLELPESQVLEIDRNPHIKIDRNPNGTDRIIDVLARNDQDPIVEYQKEAKEICARLADYVRKSYR